MSGRFALELYTDGSHEPTALLRDEDGVEATAVVMCIQEVVDIKTKGDGPKGVFAT